MRDIDQQFRLGERFDAKLSRDGGDDFGGLGGECGGVYKDSGAEFLVVEGVDEGFHEGDGDGGVCGEFDVEGGELDFRGGGCAGKETECLASVY